ncbi:MAG TPA: hypothetical protein VK712_03810 [Verrucomicrobiae bacterium]|jgi:hypothetical protein|nr:hypothetical protein [Verrucomicrobiae bacterium]
MRNFNQPIAVALASAASLLGSNALVAQAQAEMPVSPPQLFDQCAQGATEGAIENVSSLSLSIGVQPGIVGQATFRLKNLQTNPIKTESGIYCDGLAGAKDTLQLKVGSFSETIPNADTQIAFTNTSLQEPVGAFAKGGFSYQRACQIARQQKGTAVDVDIHQKLTYTEEGYPTSTSQDDFDLGSLPCRQNKLGYEIDGSL